MDLGSMQEKFVKNLQGMVRIKTVSDIDTEKMDSEKFSELHKYIEDTYPLVHKKLEKEKIGKFGLLYKWKGSGKTEKLPLMLIAHQDVVPEGDEKLWTYPPYSGTIADGCLWSRGTTDSKNNIQAYMDAIEILIEEGFEPDYDLYLGFGYNEEIMGGPEPAAVLIREHLKEKGIVLGGLIDECGGIGESSDGERYATIYIGEKGYADFKFTCRDSGGHSATPKKHSALGRVAEVATILETNPMEPVLIPEVARQLSMSAAYIKNEDLKELLKDPEKNWEELRPKMEEDPELNSYIRTTFAVTMAKGSAQANILPEEAWIIVNTRIMPGTTVNDLMEYFRKIVPEDIEIEMVKGSDPPPVQSTETRLYKDIEKSLHDQYPGIPLIPSLMTGGTDSRYYCEICPSDSVYRMTGMFYDKRTGGAHKANEKIACDIIPGNVRFYMDVLKKYNED